MTSPRTASYSGVLQKLDRHSPLDGRWNSHIETTFDFFRLACLLMAFRILELGLAPLSAGIRRWLLLSHRAPSAHQFL